MDTMLKIHENGHSRVPVYRDKRENIVGMLLVKRLMVLDAAEYAVTYAAPCCPMLAVGCVAWWLCCIDCSFCKQRSPRWRLGYANADHDRGEPTAAGSAQRLPERRPLLRTCCIRLPRPSCVAAYRACCVLFMSHVASRMQPIVRLSVVVVGGDSCTC